MWWNASALASGRADFSQPFPQMPQLGLVTHEREGAAVRLGGLPADIATATARLSSTTAAGALGPAAHTEQQSAAIGGGGRVRLGAHRCDRRLQRVLAGRATPAAQRGLDQACALVDLRAVPRIAWTKGILRRAMDPPRSEEPRSGPRGIGGAFASRVRRRGSMSRSPFGSESSCSGAGRGQVAGRGGRPSGRGGRRWPAQQGGSRRPSTRRPVNEWYGHGVSLVTTRLPLPAGIANMDSFPPSIGATIPRN